MVPDGYGRHTPTLAGVKIIRAMSLDVALLPFIGDAISILASEYQWVEVGDAVLDVVQACSAAVASWYGAVMIGQVSFFLGSLPLGWLALDGTTYDEVDYPELFDLLDAQFKDEVLSEFSLPDLGGLFPLVANGSFLLGDSDGASSVTLSIGELPSHNHTYIQPVANVDLEAPGVPDILAAGVGPGTTTGSTGGGEGHENMPPYFVLVAGVFSGRE